MLDQPYIRKIRDLAYTICIQVCCCDGFRTGIWGIGEHDCGSSKVGVELSKGPCCESSALSDCVLLSSPDTVHVSAIRRFKAFAPGRQNKSKKGCCKSSG